MVCLSGGKDSYALLDILLACKNRRRLIFSLVAVNLDQKQPGFPEHVLPAYLDSLGIEYRIVEEDTYSIVKLVRFPKAKPPAACAQRSRRGILYRVADELGATKIAPGPSPRRHPANAVPEYVLRRQAQGHAALLLSDDGKHMVIRPLAYCREKT